MNRHETRRVWWLMAVILVWGARAGHAQMAAASMAPAGGAAASAVSDEYIIGPDDVLGIVFWRDKDLTADAIVRPDGKISLPLLNEVEAAGLRPSQLRARLVEEARRYLEDPNVTVIVRQINSRKVFVTGEVIKPGSYALTGQTSVLQMLAMAGGLKEYADAKNIKVMRSEDGRTVSYAFNYRDVSKGKGLSQNRDLKPGDTIVVP